WAGQLGISEDRHLPGLTRLAEAIREAGGASSVQLHHGGLRGNPDVTGRTNLAPWDDPEKQARDLTTDEVHRSVADFVDGARRAERRSEEHTSELQSRFDHLCRLLLHSKNSALTTAGF